MTTRYGIISDIHKAGIDDVKSGIETLVNEVDAIVLNGDVWGNENEDGLNPKNYLHQLLAFLGGKEIPVYILPGSHETVEEFEEIALKAHKKFTNLTLILEGVTSFKNKDHTLIFLPGSDFRAGEASNWGYAVLDEEYKTGLYQKGSHKMRIINPNDLSRTLKELNDPNKAILFAHIPMKFETDGAVDVAEYLDIQGQRIPAAVLKANGFYEKFLNLIKKENVGNKTLRGIIENSGIRKYISGHIHEFVWNAHTLKEKPVAPLEETNELFFNASYLDGGKIAIVEFNGNTAKVKYSKIQL